jgi:hypothetical protein
MREGEFIKTDARRESDYHLAVDPLASASGIGVASSIPIIRSAACARAGG